MVYGPPFPTIRVVSNTVSKGRKDQQSKDIGGDTTCVLKTFLQWILFLPRIHSRKISMNHDHSHPNSLVFQPLSFWQYPQDPCDMVYLPIHATIKDVNYTLENLPGC